MDLRHSYRGLATHDRDVFVVEVGTLVLPTGFPGDEVPGTLRDVGQSKGRSTELRGLKTLF